MGDMIESKNITGLSIEIGAYCIEFVLSLLDPQSHYKKGGV